MSLKNAAIAGGIWYTFATVTIGIADLTLVAVLSRMLSPADFGIMAMVMLVCGFAGEYIDLGLCAAVIQRKNITREQFSTVYWLIVFSGVLLFLIISTASPLIALFFREPLLEHLLPVAAICCILTAIGVPFDCMLEKEFRFETLAKMDITQVVFGIIVAAIGGFCGLGIWALVWGIVSRKLVATIWLLVVGLPKWKPLLLFHSTELRGYARFGLFQMGERTLVRLNYTTDQLLVGALLGAQQLGYYNFAVNQLLQPICSLSPIILRIAFPLFTHMQDDRSATERYYLKIMRLLNTLNAPLLFGLAALAPMIVPLVFGAQWIPSIRIMQVLSFCMFCRNAGGALGPLLLAKGEAGLSFRWNLAVYLGTAPFVAVGAIFGGTIGLAIALSLAMALRLPANYFFIMRPLMGASGTLFSSCILKPAFISLLMGVSLWCISIFLKPSILVLIVETFVGIVMYLILMRYFDPAHFVEVKELLLGFRRSEVSIAK